MNGVHQIKFVQHADIDAEAWDRCIDQSSNGLIYAYSYYLDIMARHWDALVLGNYEAVMPLTWNRKFRIHYLYQPFLTAQLGVFGNSISEELINSFLEAIPRKFKFWEIFLNHENAITSKRFGAYERVNYVLDLSPDYETTRAGYSDNILRNIKKADQSGCRFERDLEPEKVIMLAMKQVKSMGKDAKENLARFSQLNACLEKRNQSRAYGVSDKNGNLLSSCIFFTSHNRAYYILVGNDEASRNYGSSHYLVDSFIKQNAGKNLLLDFEGSDIPSLARFYAGFGAKEENYLGVRVNRLPLGVRWLKG